MAGWGSGGRAADWFLSRDQVTLATIELCVYCALLVGHTVCFRSSAAEAEHPVVEP